MVKAGRSKSRRHLTARFTRSEIAEMEKLILDGKCDLLDQSFCQKLAEKFNLTSSRTGSRTLHSKQVEKWFQNKQQYNEDAHPSSPSQLKETTDISDTSLSSIAPESSTDTRKGTGEKASELLELEFEAKSARDGAWYDVATFLAHRVLSNGEPEVRVRFQGYGADHDEWINVKKGIRERSIPLESSECQKVEIGDLVLCFQESSEQAIYFDAHISDIERKLHDIRGCRCHFLVRYDHDGTEERVPLRRLCRRPIR